MVGAPIPSRGSRISPVADFGRMIPDISSRNATHVNAKVKMRNTITCRTEPAGSVRAISGLLLARLVIESFIRLLFRVDANYEYR
jgi:hypothetical protein